MKKIQFLVMGILSLLVFSCKKEEHINKNLKFNNIQEAKFLISVDGFNYDEGDQFAVTVFSSVDTNSDIALMQFDLNGEVQYVPNILRLNKEFFESNPSVEIVSKQGMTDISCRIVARNYGQPFYLNIETWINNQKVKDEKRLVVDEENNFNATFNYFN